MIASLDELRTRIHEYLCEYDQLVPGAFPLVERILIRKGKPCGLYFCLHGPRAVKFSAIWDSERNTVLFYGPDGERYHRLTLTPAAGQWQSTAA